MLLRINFNKMEGKQDRLIISSCNSKTESGLFNEEINEDYQSKDIA